MHEMHEMRSQTGKAGHSTLLTTQEVQALIKVDKSTIYRMAESGRIPAIKVGRQWRFPEDRIRAWLDGASLMGPDVAVQTPVPANGAGITAVLTRESIQALTDLLGELLGAMVLLTDIAGNPLSDVGNPCGLFEAVRDEPGVMDHCIKGWERLGLQLDFEPRWEPTPLGFDCARGLVRSGSELSAMVVVGGVEPEAWPPSPERIAELADGLSVDAATMAAHIGEVHRLDAKERGRVLDLLPRIGTLISRLADERGRPVSKLDTIAALAGEPPPRSKT